ncbi:MAG: hypothetical protein R3A51_15085 [Nannocystaceae bacterium]|nr:hypothetical protein [Myxococcales bacterium]
MSNHAELSTFICDSFSDHVQIEPGVLYGDDLSLAAIIKLSPKMHNSVDLMEAFARTANALRRARGIRVRLPTLHLDTPISRVLELFLSEAAAAAAPKRTA